MAMRQIEMPDGTVQITGNNPVLSGYLTIFNGIRGNFPFIEAITSLCGFCDEVIVMDGESDDGTVRAIQMLAKNYPQIRLLQSKYDPTFPLMDGAQKQLARMACTGRVVFQLDADEVVHETGWQYLKDMALQMKPEHNVICLPILNCHGKADRGNCDRGATPWKWRMSWNERHWGHGVQIDSRRVNAEGVPYSAYTDGCEWIDFNTGQFVPQNGWVMPVRPDPIQMSVQMENACRTIPVVWHVGGADLLGKAKRFHSFWKGQWKVLRQTDDSAEGKTWGTDLDMENPTEEDFQKAVDNFLAKSVTYKIWMPPPQLLLPWLGKVGAI
jgi:glycosyltransferase involved in cell wall biosynthesis